MRCSAWYLPVQYALQASPQAKADLLLPSARLQAADEFRRRPPGWRPLKTLKVCSVYQRISLIYPPFAPSNRSLIIRPIGCCECFDGYLRGDCSPPYDPLSTEGSHRIDGLKPPERHAKCRVAPYSPSSTFFSCVGRKT
jgi:hypothetical protein